MVIIKSRRVGTTRTRTRMRTRTTTTTTTSTTKGLRTDDRCSAETTTTTAARKGTAASAVRGLVDGGARTEYFNFLRGARGRVGAGEQFTRTVWLACLPGVDRRALGAGWKKGVSLDGRPPTSTLSRFSGSEATPSAPTSPPLPLLLLLLPPALLPLRLQADRLRAVS